MKIVIHDLLKRSQQTYEGDALTLERELRHDYPWAVLGHEGDIDTILYNLDHAQTISIEVADPTPHPFLKG